MSSSGMSSPITTCLVQTSTPIHLTRQFASLGITRQASQAHPSGPALTTREWLSFSVEVAADKEAAEDVEGYQKGVKELVEEQMPAKAEAEATE
jgi:hypothetical protein